MAASYAHLMSLESLAVVDECLHSVNCADSHRVGNRFAASRRLSRVERQQP